MEKILEIKNLCKDYRSDWTFRPTRVLSSLDFDVRRGECFGLLGHNGAGKTTTFKLILGFLRPTSGAILFDGHPLTPAARATIGFLPEHPYFYEYLSVQETLELFATLYGMSRAERGKRIDEVVERLGLGHKRRAALRSLSKGLLQRVGVAQAILNRPRLLVLDEPMSGLDPVGRREMRELIREIRDQGTSVIFSSHILPDAETLCDRVGILAAGRLCEIVELREHAQPDHFEIAFRSINGTVRKDLELLGGSIVTDRDGLQIFRLSEQQIVDRAIDLIRDRNASIQSITPRFTSLEERFLRYVGN